MDPHASRLEADYLLETPLDPRKVAEVLAGEQSSGTFVRVAGMNKYFVVSAGSPVVALAEELRDLFDAITGTFRIVLVPGASRAAAISLRAEFLAPPT